MSYTNSTTNYHLPQYLGSDKPTYLGDFNTAMDTIDTQMKDNHDKAFLAQSAADTAQASVGTLSTLTTTDKSSAVAAINEVNATAANAAVNATAAIANVGTLANLTTTDKSSAVAAINEINSQAGGVGDLSTLTTTDKSSAVAAINEVNGKVDHNKTNVEALYAKLNLKPTGKTITVTSPDYGGTITSNVMSAVSEDGSIAKLYGVINGDNATGSDSQRTFNLSDTGIYPDQDMTVVGHLLLWNYAQGGGTAGGIGSVTIKTDGTATFTCWAGATYWRQNIGLIDALIFVKDFDDPYIPPVPQP